MFIFCKVRTQFIPYSECGMQSWAVDGPFSGIYRCPAHGLVDADGNILKTIQTRIDIEGAIRP
jgi:hypothetical protein